MQTDILIIGQGICGTFLSWWLEKAGLSCLVMDEPRLFTASKAAAGLINPVTGRRIVKTWMIDELLPFAQEAYRQLGEELGTEFIRQKNLIDFFPTPQMRLAFLDRFAKDPQYLQLPEDEQTWNEYFRYDFGYGVISPCWLVDLPRLLELSRKRLLERKTLLEERFEADELIVEKQSAGATVDSIGGQKDRSTRGIRYKDISARHIIFCDGVESAASQWFSLLPFAPNKGEALIVEIPGLVGAGGLERQHAGTDRQYDGAAVFKKGLTLAPWKEGMYWIGSSYEWSFQDTGPTELFRIRTEAGLKDWLKVPFTTVEHIASVRPATLERRPFVGFHPRYPAIGILNGMGTKGCSLAPWFASQLAQYIAEGTPILPEADIKRFSRVLSR
ncbi:MAG TPA: FAD-binding oxidoreductase [Puia sp.]|nr:FAD-binding oxidoreductase [Puia sp.]